MHLLGVQRCRLRIPAWGNRTDKNELCRWMLRRCRRCIKPPQLAHSPSLSIHWRARRARRDRGPEIRTVPMFHLWHLVQSHASDFRRRLIAPESTLRAITISRKHFYTCTLKALQGTAYVRFSGFVIINRVRHGLFAISTNVFCIVHLDASSWRASNVLKDTCCTAKRLSRCMFVTQDI